MRGLSGTLTLRNYYRPAVIGIDVTEIITISIRTRRRALSCQFSRRNEAVFSVMISVMPCVSRADVSFYQLHPGSAVAEK